MRIWSIHPKHLDTKGLVALWRETLLAKHVLEGKTKGYLNHPQLNRFKTMSDPVAGINQYLAAVYEEALNRNFKFSKEKINWDFIECTLTVTQGQLAYEIEHLLNKLNARDESNYKELMNTHNPSTHPMFVVVEGDIEDWEIITPTKVKSK